MRDEEQETQNTFSRSHLWPSQTSRVDNPEERQNDCKKHERQNQAHSGTFFAPDTPRAALGNYRKIGSRINGNDICCS
jgi:hypothetical protein